MVDEIFSEIEIRRRLEEAQEKAKEMALPVLLKLIRKMANNPKFRPPKGIDSFGGSPGEIRKMLESENPISNLKLAPTPDGLGHTFHFNIGSAEFHIMGEAAEYINKQILD